METWKYWIWQKNHFIYYVCIKLVNYILILHGIFCLLAFYIWLDWPQRPKHASKSPTPHNSRKSRSVSKSPKPRNSRRSQSMSKSPKPRSSRRSQSRSRSRSGSLSRFSFLMCLFFVDHINCWSFFNWLEKWLCGQSLGRLMHNHYKCLLTLSFHIEVISCRLVFVITITILLNLGYNFTGKFASWNKLISSCCDWECCCAWKDQHEVLGVIFSCKEVTWNGFWISWSMRN